MTARRFLPELRQGFFRVRRFHACGSLPVSSTRCEATCASWSGHHSRQFLPGRPESLADEERRRRTNSLCSQRSSDGSSGTARHGPSATGTDATRAATRDACREGGRLRLPRTWPALSSQCEVAARLAGSGKQGARLGHLRPRLLLASTRTVPQSDHTKAERPLLAREIRSEPRT